MARTNTLINFLTDVASAIKTKKGDNTPIQASNFDTEIANLPGGSSYNWSQIGYSEEPDAIQESFNYAKNIYDNWDNTITDRKKEFQNDRKMIFFPDVDMSHVTDASYMFQYAPLIQVGDNFDFSNLSNASYMFYYSALKYLNNVELNNYVTTVSMFESINDLQINNFVSTGSYSSSSYNNNKNVLINNLSIRSGTRTLFISCENLDIKKITNYDNHTSRSYSLLSNCTLTNDAVDEFLKYFKTLTDQSSGNKKLSTMGFSQANCDQAILSSEWADLQSAGWTTGY